MQPEKKIYCISGLGADHRVFKNLEAPEGYQILPLQWIDPEPGESLRAYARRLAEKIDDSIPFVLLGVSMGGMMAVEVSKIKKPMTTILISSVPSHQYLPRHFRWAYKLGLQNKVPVSFLKKGSFLKRYFTHETNEDKKLVRQIIQESDPGFIQWGMNAVLEWNGSIEEKQYYHIHGSADWLLPIGNMKPTHIIKNAGHLMILERAADINTILRKILPTPTPSHTQHLTPNT